MAVVIDGTNGVTLPEPLIIESGSLSSPAVSGQIEYDGKVFYQTPQGTQRGVMPGVQFYRLNSTVAGSDVTTAQSVFGVGVTLSSSTVYAFEAVYAFSKVGGTATSQNFGVGFGGTATVNNIAFRVTPTWSYSSFTALASNATTPVYSQTTSNVNVQTGLASANVYFHMIVMGTVSINAGGTFIPQYTLSVATGAYTTAIGSHFLIYPIGASGSNTSVGIWA